MVTLIRNGDVFAPEPLGRKDVLAAGGVIAAVADPGRIRVEGLEADVVDAAGRRVLPGLIDPHVHILGGGGEGGPATRAPEIRVEDIVSSGVTTVIGCLGTDGVTRHMTSLLAKARALEIEGVSTFVFSGSYEIPVKTLTGSVRSDLILIDKVVGAGEIAVSDHRSSQPTFEEIARLAAECRVGGMLGGKAGVLHLHLGDGKRRLEFLFRLIRETEIPVTQVIPTHINRNPQLFEHGLEWAAAGGSVDLTVGPDPEPPDPEVRPEDAIARFSGMGLPLTRMMASSDSNGSLPVFDANGRLVRLTIATERDFFRKFMEIIRKEILPIETAVRVFSTNSADFYKLGKKGRIEPGRDADLIVLDADLGLSDVFARGKRMIAGGRLLARGTFSS
ncbi:MAG: beta-aspartyl-peptidase [Candidatus Aminicenantes bacterium RBG_16_66_30]|nr:MAG: beta-aspartyl-peptidase [Candidatus Aminicenantes bacterium RBG_16_66_30]